MSEARASLHSGRLGQRWRTLEAVRAAAGLRAELELPAARRDELRNLAIAALALPDVQVARAWDAAPQGTRAVPFDDRLESYARIDGDGLLTVRRAADDAELARLPHAAPGEAVVFLTPGAGHVAVWDWPNQTARWYRRADGPLTLVREDTKVAAFNFSPSAHWRASPTPTAGSRCSTRRRPGPGRPGAAWGTSADSPSPRRSGSWPCAGGARGRPRPRSGRPRALEPVGSGGDLVWHPDDRTLAVPSGEEKLTLWDVPTRALKQTLTSNRGGGLYAAFNRQGDRLVTSDWADALRLWDVNTGEMLLRAEGKFWNPSFGPDDRLAGVVEGKAGILEVHPGRKHRTLRLQVPGG